MMDIETDKTKQIMEHLFSPHYTDESFKRMKTVFLAKGYNLTKAGLANGKGIVYNYDDRIRQWNWDKADNCWQQIKTMYDQYNSAAVHEHYLRLYFDDPQLELVHIMTGVNWSTGYYYRVYGYVATPPVAANTDSTGNEDANE